MVYCQLCVLKCPFTNNSMGTFDNLFFKKNLKCSTKLRLDVQLIVMLDAPREPIACPEWSNANQDLIVIKYEISQKDETSLVEEASKG